MPTVLDLYNTALNERGFQADPAQQAAVLRLQQCYDEWVDYRSQRSNAFMKLITRPDVPRGVYLYGGVGRGKSFLMDAFYLAVPLKRKTRLHFHEFMREVHRELEELKGQQNPLDELALRISKKYRLICFDEFHVSDIADAMILYRLLKALFENRVSLIATSNYHPDGIYPDGLHRDRVLPAIELLKTKLDVVNVDNGIDYRRRTLAQVQLYHAPLGAMAEVALAKAFDSIAEVKDEDPILKIEHRELRARRRAGGVVWFDFATLCDGPRSQNDYLEIAARFHTVILSNVPAMSPRLANAARRFTWLVDVFYDRRVKLIMSAEVAVELLYTEGPMAFEFTRTVSRIVEMQSQEFLGLERREVVTALV